jgi:subtilase family serine protease
MLLTACGGGAARLLPPTSPNPALSTESATRVMPGTATNDLPGESKEHPCGNPLSGNVACHIVLNTGIQALRESVLPAERVPGLHPADLQAAYGFSGSGGNGNTVAVIVAYDDPAVEYDLGIYRRTFGLPPCTTGNGCFKKVKTRRGERLLAVNAGWALETALDVEMVSAICPQCRILVVEAPSTNLKDMIDAHRTAIANGATVISDSFYIGESSGELEHEAVLKTVSQSATIVASAGDAGAGARYPASSKYVVAVGGTSLVRASNARGWSETAWQHTSAGCSTIVTKPAWQSDPLCGRRTVADLAVVGDPGTGVSVYNSFIASRAPGGWSVVGGTSAGAPIVAAMIASSNGTGVFGADRLYQHPLAFNAITSGETTNCNPVTYLCAAMPGYNGPTGLGSPIGPASFQ